MLNRYGLVDIDIDKILREQNEPLPPGEPPPPPGAEAPPLPPAEPPEDPDEKRKKTQDNNRDDDLVEFRKDHADAIYRMVRASGDGWGANTLGQSLRSKFGSSGIDAPFVSIFDRETTGLDGDAHLSLLARLSGGKKSGDQITLRSPGAAKEFADAAGQMRDDLTFEQDPANARSVKISKAQEKETEQPPSRSEV